MHLKLFALSSLWPRLLRLFSSDSGVWISLGLLICLAIYGQFNVRAARGWVSHTFEVLDSLQQLESKLLEADAYLQTLAAAPASDTLASYQETIAAAQAQLSELRSLTADNALQQQQFHRLKLLLEDHLFQQQALLQRLSAGAPARPAQPAPLPQPLYSDGIKDQLLAIEQQEKWLLEQRRVAVDRQGFFASAIMVGGVLFVALMIARLHRARQRQRQIERELNQRLQLISIEQEQLQQRVQAIALEQDLSSHLLTCRTLDEAHEILRSLLDHLIPNCPGGLYEINSSRDQMQPTILLGQFSGAGARSPRECWALRRGEVQSGHHATFAIPCQLCRLFYGGDIPATMLCLPLQAHEKTIGMLHLAMVPPQQQSMIITLARQVSLPLAVLHLQSELEYLSFHDANTGLYNRRFLDEMLERAIAIAKRQNHQLSNGARPYTVGVIFMDVDHFKRFNSEYGHEMGDTVLRMLGAFLREITRSGEDVPCRYGGEEFLLVMPGASEEATLAKAEAIREGIKRRPTPTGATISLSLGVAVYPQYGATATEVLKAANEALLQAKTQGRDRVLLAR